MQGNNNSGSEEQCVKCKGTGKITIFRNDLEELEEIEYISFKK